MNFSLDEVGFDPLTIALKIAVIFFEMIMSTLAITICANQT
jgi:hypothetical protein